MKAEEFIEHLVLFHDWPINPRKPERGTVIIHYIGGPSVQSLPKEEEKVG